MNGNVTKMSSGIAMLFLLLLLLSVGGVWRVKLLGSRKEKVSPFYESFQGARARAIGQPAEGTTEGRCVNFQIWKKAGAY